MRINITCKMVIFVIVVFKKTLSSFKQALIVLWKSVWVGRKVVTLCKSPAVFLSVL